MKRQSGLTMLEVLIALVIMGLVATLFAQSTQMSRKVSGKSVNWVQEGVAIEKTLENLKLGHTLSGLRSMDSIWVDSTGQFPIQLSAIGAAPTEAQCPGYPVQNLVRMVVSARRSSYTDSVVVTSFIWLP